MKSSYDNPGRTTGTSVNHCSDRCSLLSAGHCHGKENQTVKKASMKTIWTYITTLFAGIIAGLLLFLKLDSPETVINDHTTIGKMKQRGQGNAASTTIDHPIDQSAGETSPNDPKEARLLRRLTRNRERRDKKESG
jgi:hypothetical protein